MRRKRLAKGFTITAKESVGLAAVMKKRLKRMVKTWEGQRWLVRMPASSNAARRAARKSLPFQRRGQMAWWL